MKPSFGANKSKNDYRTVTSDQIRARATILPQTAKVDLQKPTTNDISAQAKLGICTACSVRMAAEEAFNDGKRLSEYWLYLMGKVLIEGETGEGSSAFTMLKAANKFGIPEDIMEAEFPLYITGNYEQFINSFKTRYGGKIPQKVFDNASKHKIPGYYKVAVSPTALATEIYNGKALVFYLRVGDNTYKDKWGNVSWLAKDLLPLRVPKYFDGGHLMVINEYSGLNEFQKLSGPNSFSKEWCKDQPEGYQGYFNFIFKTQKPYFWEAWAISEIPEEIKEEIKDLPAPIVQIIQKSDSEEWKKLFVYWLKKFNVIK